VCIRWSLCRTRLEAVMLPCLSAWIVFQPDNCMSTNPSTPWNRSFTLHSIILALKVNNVRLVCWADECVCIVIKLMVRSGSHILRVYLNDNVKCKMLYFQVRRSLGRVGSQYHRVWSVPEKWTRNLYTLCCLVLISLYQWCIRQS